MADRFDPYHKWLGIPPDEQPANHYRLLGLRDFETDPDVIESAADRQMAHVQTHKTGPQSALSQKLLNELAAARICLLDPSRRSSYDQTMRASRAAQAPIGVAMPAEIPIAYSATVPPGYQQAAPAPVAHASSPTGPQISVTASAGRAHSRHRQTHRPLLQIASVLVTLLLLGAAFYAVRSKEQPTPDVLAGNAASQTVVGGKPQQSAPSAIAAAATVGSVPGSATPNIAMPDGANAAPSNEIGPGPTSTDSIASGNTGNTLSNGNPSLPGPAPSGASQTPSASPAQETQPAQASSQPTRPQRLSAPIGEALDEAKQAVDAMFQSEINQAKTPTEQHAVARRMFDRSFSVDLSPNVSHELLRRAAEVAAAGGRYDVACEAIDTMAGRFETDTVRLKTDALNAADRFAKSPSELRALSDAWAKLAGEATNADQYEAARRCLDQAVVVARKTSDKTLIARLVESAKEAAAIQAAYDEAAPAQERLATHPGDPVPAAAWGRFLCLYKNDWDNGLAVWARGLDNLSALARQDLGRPPFSTEQLDLADRWWDAGEGATEEVAKKRLRLRAAYWYRYAKLGASRGELARIQERIDLTERDVSAFPIDEWVDLIKTVDLQKHIREGKWDTNGNLLAAPAQGINYLMIPVTANGSYELESMLTFGPKGGTEVNFVFPVGDRSCAVILFGWNGKISGLHQIDGKNSDNNETTVRGVGAVRGQRFKVLIQVELVGDEATISIDLNGRKFIRWQGSAARLSISNHVALPHPGAFAVRSFRSPLVVNSLKLRVHSGVAKRLD